MKKDVKFVTDFMALAVENGYHVEVETVEGGTYGCSPEEGEPWGSGFSIVLKIDNDHEWDKEAFDRVAKLMTDYADGDKRFGPNRAREGNEAKRAIKETMKELGLGDGDFDLQKAMRAAMKLKAKLETKEHEGEGGVKH